MNLSKQNENETKDAIDGALILSFHGFRTKFHSRLNYRNYPVLQLTIAQFINLFILYAELKLLKLICHFCFPTTDS